MLFGTTDKKILEIGCGDKKQFTDSITLDIRRTPVVDIICDAHNLPIKTESVDYIYSSHTIEHFSHTDIQRVLAEWCRALKTGGTLELRCPDLRARALLFSLNPSWGDIANIYGGQDYPENTHKCGFSYSMLKVLLTSIGIEKVKRIYDGYKGIPFLPSDLHVIGNKRY